MSLSHLLIWRQTPQQAQAGGQRLALRKGLDLAIHLQRAACARGGPLRADLQKAHGDRKSVV